VVRRGVIVGHVPYHLNPSVWEHQSAALDCIYHTARQSTGGGDILGDILVITQ